MIKHQNSFKTKRTVFSKTCVEIMGFFLSHSDIYFTPLTVALSMDRPSPTIKDCIHLLRENQYLSKVTGSVYKIKSENMEFWRTDFKNHMLAKMEIKH